MTFCTKFVCTLAVLFSAGVLACAQAQPPTANQPPDPQLKLNPVEAIRAFEPPADEEYRLGGGDELQIDSVGRPELQAKTVVGPDGRVSLPVVGSISLSGQPGSLLRQPLGHGHGHQVHLEPHSAARRSRAPWSHVF